MLSKTTPLGEGPWDCGASCGHFFLVLTAIAVWSSWSCSFDVGFIYKSHEKLMIWGYHHFRNPPKEHSTITHGGTTTVMAPPNHPSYSVDLSVETRADLGIKKF